MCTTPAGPRTRRYSRCSGAFRDETRDSPLSPPKGLHPTDHCQIEQYLHSDLSHTTLPSGLIPAQAHNIHLFPQPTLLQLISLTEIAASAFQLQTVLEQRRDVLDGASRIRRMDDEDTEDEEVGEGKLPSYPRGMLRLELTDGERVIKGIEYRRIEGLVLGETALGCKVS